MNCCAELNKYWKRKQPKARTLLRSKQPHLQPKPRRQPPLTPSSTSLKHKCQSRVSNAHDHPDHAPKFSSQPMRKARRKPARPNGSTNNP
jgi:hypothetical protein